MVLGGAGDGDVGEAFAGEDFLHRAGGDGLAIAVAAEVG